MPKRYKIKRYMHPAGVYKARPHPLFIALTLIVAGALVYVGVILYPPIYNLIMGGGNRSPVEPSAPPSEEVSGTEEVSSAAEEGPSPVSGLRAVYIPPALVSDPAALDRFLETVPDDINSVMVDIKDKNGQVLFLTSNQNANKWNVVRPGAADLAAFSKKLDENGFSLIARMSAFRDDMAARADLGNAVNYRASGTTWLDNFPDMGGKAWLNPYSAVARQYITDLALEAVDAGAVLIVFDDFHFPPNSLTGDAFFGPEASGVPRDRCLSDFSGLLRDTLEEKGSRAAIYMNAGVIASPPNPTLYNCPAQDILSGDLLLGALPYQFPAEGFSSEKLNIKHPLLSPADTVKQAVGFVLDTVGGIKTIALIQGGTEAGATGYTAAQIRAQIDALTGLGVDEYILYCTNPANYLW